MSTSLNLTVSDRWLPNAMHDIVFTIDPDVRRRASLSFFLNNQGIFTEPFETVEEFLASGPKSGVLLIHDDPADIAALTRELCARQTWFRIIAYSADPAPAAVVDAVIAGAIGYALWPGCGERLIEVINDARERAEFHPANGLRQPMATARIEKLSRRERQVLAAMTEGLSNRLIGQHLGISARTVELHRANLLLKTGSKHSSEAIRLAIEANLPAFESARSDEV